MVTPGDAKGIAGLESEHMQRLAADNAGLRGKARFPTLQKEVRAELAAEGVMKLVGAIYGLKSGRVRFLP